MVLPYAQNSSSDTPKRASSPPNASSLPWFASGFSNQLTSTHINPPIPPTPSPQTQSNFLQTHDNDPTATYDQCSITIVESIVPKLIVSSHIDCHHMVTCSKDGILKPYHLHKISHDICGFHYLY